MGDPVPPERDHDASACPGGRSARPVADCRHLFTARHLARLALVWHVGRARRCAGPLLVRVLEGMSYVGGMWVVMPVREPGPRHRMAPDGGRPA